jgi:hypothetical protein
MSKKRDFDNILDECLTRVQKGESIEACLATHPEQSAELKPLLRTALAARQAAAVQPRREFRERAALEFQAAIREMPAKATGWGTPWRRRLMEVVAGVVFVLLAGTGLVAASSSSLPDEPLYAIKTATETAWLALTPSDIGKANLYIKFTNRRVAEIIAMAGESKVAPLDKATDRLNNEMIAMAGLTASVEATGATTFGMTETTSPPMLAAPAPTTKATTTTPEVSSTTAVPTTTATTTRPSQMVTPTVTNPPPVALSSVPDNGIVTTPPPAPQPEGKHYFNTDIQDEQAALRDALARSAAANSTALQEELDKAPESVRASLEKAIEVANSGYQQNLSNLGQ